MTDTGIRVPIHESNTLMPRKHYERKEAAFLAYQGFIHYAELVESGHDAAAVQLALAYYRKTGRTIVPDKELNLDSYANWSRKAVLANDTVQMGLMLEGLVSGIANLRRAWKMPFIEPDPVFDHPTSGPATSQRVLQVGEDQLSADSAFAMSNRTGHTLTTLGPGNLEGANEVTVVGHGVVIKGKPGAIALKVGPKQYTPKAFAKALVDSGWKGGTVRLGACDTGLCNPYGQIFGQELANELSALKVGSAVDSIVIAPVGGVEFLYGETPPGYEPKQSLTHGVPKVMPKQPPGNQSFLDNGKGWEIFFGNK
jgi:hypothetical protein